MSETTLKKRKLSESSNMGSDDTLSVFALMQALSVPHPWHGVSPGPKAPETVVAYIECVPGDGLKYEIDKLSGLLKVDRPQRFSSLLPTCYGFIPRTYCDTRVAQRCMDATGLKQIEGDQDPIDICVLSSKTITHGNILVTARVIGGLRMIDDGEADDKIVAVLEGDAVYSEYKDISDLPDALLLQLRHYFETYKQSPGSLKKSVVIPEIYGAKEAVDTVQASLDDYADSFSAIKTIVEQNWELFSKKKNTFEKLRTQSSTPIAEKK